MPGWLAKTAQPMLPSVSASYVQCLLRRDNEGGNQLQCTALPDSCPMQQMGRSRRRRVGESWEFRVSGESGAGREEKELKIWG